MAGKVKYYLYQLQQLLETLHHDRKALEALYACCLQNINNLYRKIQFFKCTDNFKRTPETGEDKIYECKRNSKLLEIIS